MTAITGAYARLTPDTRARVAFMRFGLGPKPGARMRMGTGVDAAYEACLRELNNPRAAEIGDNDVIVKLADGTMFAATKEKCGEHTANPLSAYQVMSIFQAEGTARYVKNLEPEVGFVERLVQFWSNHFSVLNLKARGAVGLMERHAIRPNVLGNFGDMLEAVVTHPAMVLFLDNQSSFGPTSALGKARKATYNENLAREILELHTVGVNGGYSQEDVTAFANILTGWHVGRHGQPGAGQFLYVDQAHEKKPFTVMGNSYPQLDGLEQGKAVLRDLAIHPKTARHIAFKLIRHFIKDMPSREDVTTLAGVFTRTRGDLLAVSKALLELPSAWEEPFSRFQQPYLWLVSITRGLGMNPAQMVTNRWRYDVFCTHMGQSPWWRITPDGWPDENYVWMTPDALRIRVDLASKITGYAVLAPQWHGLRPPDLVRDLFGDSFSTESMAEISSWAKDDRIALSLLFLTPEYLRR